ncbi:hypothetical protein IGI04_017749 [Brassica rapa subsp. trilocularis]|uniref:Uncharacterized protein n=1 Tax=Brassica rapa subsp. trilocularis TaxID=1813537 RepID=A0ABQ7MDD6_BRACM|nr:hypothetical protein IGI04_017749 [Brassica rapa subsp. trilocularis]
MAMKSVQSSGKSPLALYFNNLTPSTTTPYKWSSGDFHSSSCELRKPFSKGSEDLVKAPATNPPAKDLEVYTVNIGQIPSALASWTTEAINSGSFCRIDPDMETWLIPKQKLLDIAESKSSWLDMNPDQDREPEDAKKCCRPHTVCPRLGSQQRHRNYSSCSPFSHFPLALVGNQAYKTQSKLGEAESKAENLKN